MRIEFSDFAKDRLREIYHYYSEVAPIRVAKRIRANIIARVKVLAHYPYMGPEEPALKGMKGGYRYVVEGNHKIIYRIEEKRILIVHVFDTRQSPDAMFSFSQ